MKKVLITICLFYFPVQEKCIAQFDQHLDSICVVCNKSTSISEKVILLGKLAGHYYAFNLFDKGDSVLHEQLLIAETSNNKDLILTALFGDAILNLDITGSKESIAKAIQLAQRGIDYAQATNQYDYLALGYVRMSNILRRQGEFDKALYNCISALSALQHTKSDSIKAITYIELGNTYLDREEAVSACTNFNNAYDLAVQMQSTYLQSRVHHSISEMYKNLLDTSRAKNELIISLSLNQQKGDRRGVMLDYYDLARLTDEKYFIQQYLEISDSLTDYINLLKGKRLMLVYIYVIEKNLGKALSYLEKEADLRQGYLNNGIESYYSVLGNIYFYTGHPDTALVYYQNAFAKLEKSANDHLARVYYGQIAECYSRMGDYRQAIRYFQKALNISTQMKDVEKIALYTEKLSDTYGKLNDFKNAFRFSKEAAAYNETIRNQSKQNDITLLGVDRENVKHQQELTLKQQKETLSRNIQLLIITIALILLFFIILYAGSFPIPMFTVKLIGFVFFISLFEFITLLIDHTILAPYVHNKPLILWLAKIMVVSVLAPIHHVLEDRLVSLLASRKLIEAKSKFSIKKWWTDFTDKFIRDKAFGDNEAIM